jgi:hypothetical protein
MLSKNRMRSFFGQAASATGGSLTSAFARAALSRPGQAFISHAGLISCLSFFAGDVAYGIKHVAPAAAFILADACLAASDYIHSENLKKYTKYALPVAGAAVIIGSGLMAQAEWNEPRRLAMLIPCALIALQGGALIFQTQMIEKAKKLSQSNSKILSNVFQPLAKYPLLTTTVTDLIGKGIMAFAALADPRFLIATALWSYADVGLICKDENVLNWLEEKKQKSTPTPPAPLSPSPRAA